MKYVINFKECLKSCAIYPENYQKDEFILNDWEVNTKWIFVESGVLRMTSNDIEGNIFNLQYIKGDFLIFPVKTNDLVPSAAMYNFQVVTKDALVYKIRPSVVKEIMTHSLECNLYIFSILQQQTSFLFAKLNDFSLHGKLGALCGQLLILGYGYGVVSNSGIKVDLDITNEEIGHFSGIAHPSSVSRLLSKLKKENVIFSSKSKIYITDLAYLKKMAPKIDEWFLTNRTVCWNIINEQFKATHKD